MGKEYDNEKILVTRSSMPPFEEYIKMIEPLWETRWLTNMGEYHKRLEEELMQYLEVEHVSLMSNGHMSLELAIQALELPQGSEVITTPYTFISTTHAIVRNGLKPVFCDIKDDYTIDENKIEDLINENTSAILAVHAYGNVCNVDEIERIAYKYNLKVIYDAAHAFGEKYKGVGIGSYGDVSTFSFHATKVFHTIEGGCVCTSKPEIYERLYNLKNFGIRNEELVVSVGANAKMNEFQAAMGLCNLRHIGEYISARKQVVEKYHECLKDADIELNVYKESIDPNYAYMPILCKDSCTRDRLYDELKEQNVFSRKYFYPITSDAACFRNKYKNVDLKIARDKANRVLVLPLYVDLKETQVSRISEIVRNICNG